MSSSIEYLIQLHRNGVISDNDLRKGIRALNVPETPSTPTSKASPLAPIASPASPPTGLSSEKRAKRNKKKKEKRQKQKYAHLKKAVIDELKKVLAQRTVPELKLVDRPLCDYFKAYEIDAYSYKDPSVLFKDKKSLIIDQIKADIKEYNGIKFSVGLSIEFFHDEGDGTQKFVLGQNHGEQCAVLEGSKLSEFYDKQTAYLQTWIEKFTNTASGLQIAHRVKLYFNIAKYEPLKGSSYIPLPEVLANKKAIIYLQNDDNRCLEWALLSILHYNKNNPNKISSYRKYLGRLNFKGIDFPTPLSQLPKVEKQNDLAINVYGYAVSPKKQKIRVFPYYISDRPQKIPRVNILLISEDVEVDYSNDDGIIDESYDPDDKSMVDENYDPADHEDYPEPKKKKQSIATVGLETSIDF